VKKGVKFGPLFGISLIIAGALGNIIDGMFYGLIFDYAGFMQGRVVDMLYFPLFTFPEWVPWFGGEIFFSPVFNIADSAITIGIFYLIIFQWGFIRNFESIIGVGKHNGERD
jgi:signal peptidase II